MCRKDCVMILTTHLYKERSVFTLINVEEVLKENMNRIKLTYDLPDVIEEDDEIVLPEKDYIFYLCHKLNYWLNENVIYKVCKYFDKLAIYMKKNQVDFSKLDGSCQIIITAAKYYVRGVMRVKDVYNL